jgi:hypothetical protein
MSFLIEINKEIHPLILKITACGTILHVESIDPPDEMDMIVWMWVCFVFLLNQIYSLKIMI